MLLLTAALLAVAFAPPLLVPALPGYRADVWRGRLAAARNLPRWVGWQFRWRVGLWKLTGDVGALFFRRGKSTIIFAPTVASGTGAPTVAECTAGVVMDAAIAGMSGWATNLNRINQEVWKYVTDYQIEGPQQLGEAQMILLADDGGSSADETERAAVKTAMVEGATGFMLFSPSTRTIAAGVKVHNFPVKIGAVNDDLSMTTQAARYTVDFAVVGAPKKNVAVLA